MKPQIYSNRYESIPHTVNSISRVTIACVRSSAFHWHYDYELIAVLKGKIEVQYGLYGSEAQRLGCGDLIMINHKGLHGIRSIETDNLCMCIQFSPDLFEETPNGMKYLFFLNSTSEEFQPKYTYNHYMQILSSIALACRKTDEDSKLRKRAWEYMLLADLISGVQYELRSVPVNSEKDTELVMAIGGYIDQNLEQENLPELICKNFGISEKGVYRLLKEVVGLTLKEMIDAARIEHACCLLLDDKIPLQMISSECGYSGDPTFYRRFKSVMGVTPGDYRKGAEAIVVSNDIQDYISFSDYEVDLLLQHWIDAGGE